MKQTGVEGSFNDESDGELRWQEVNEVLSNLMVPSLRVSALVVVTTFLRQNEEMETSSNYRTVCLDDTSGLARILVEESIRENNNISLLLIRIVKQLSRKPANQQHFNSAMSSALFGYLSSSLDVGKYEMAEVVCGCILNFATRTESTTAMLPIIADLIRAIGTNCSPLVAAAAGALQSICMSNEGKREAIDHSSVPLLISLLQKNRSEIEEEIVHVTGALHNISSHLAAAAYFKSDGVVPLLISLLSDRTIEVVRNIAGILQSLTRDEECLEIINKHDATAPLTSLLVTNDVSLQVAAIGALLNINSSLNDDSGKRELFKKVLSFTITSCALRDAYSTEVPDDEEHPAREPSPAPTIVIPDAFFS